MTTDTGREKGAAMSATDKPAKAGNATLVRRRVLYGARATCARCGDSGKVHTDGYWTHWCSNPEPPPAPPAEAREPSTEERLAACERQLEALRRALHRVAVNGLDGSWDALALLREMEEASHV